MLYLLIRLLRAFQLALRKIYVLVGAIDERLNAKFDHGAHKVFVLRGAKKYDMHLEKNEKYYATQYGEYIKAELQRRKILSGTHLVDLACGQGRMIKELLNDNNVSFEKITGVDFSESALKKANLYLAKDNKGLSLINMEILNFLKAADDRSLEVVLLLEVLYMHPDFEEILGLLPKKLCQSGVAFISLRSDYYYGLSTLRQGMLSSTNVIKETKRGTIFGTDVELSWTNSREIKNTFPQKFNLKVGDIFGIGTCSGIPGDPHDSICIPSKLVDPEILQLRSLENYFGERYPDSGRYLLFAVSPIKNG